MTDPARVLWRKAHGRWWLDQFIGISDPPSLTLDELLDFEGACIVRVSRDLLRKNREIVRRNRVRWVLRQAHFQRKIQMTKHPIMQTLLTPEEYQEYIREDSREHRTKVIEELAAKYDVSLEMPEDSD